MSSHISSSAAHPNQPASPTSPVAPTSTMTTPAAPSTSNATSSTPAPHIRIVPHLDAPRSLHFEVVDKDVPEGFVLKIGRFTDKQALPNRVTFKSKVVSRGHAEIFTEHGKFFIRDTKSSSGTFLNHARLSPPGVESKPTLLKDGDVIQLGVDYQGGTQEIYRCVKMRLELNRSWQQQANAFSTNTLKTIRSLTTADAASCTDCCICLFRIASFQSLFVAPCSHVYHFKCIRPMLLAHHPGFLCPLCRTFADLEATVEIDDPVEEQAAVQSMYNSSYRQRPTATTFFLFSNVSCPTKCTTSSLFLM
ncbi:MAG: SMAD/FHA domain-containing protein [Linnemannia elongata]|nr:MAG: SMAD/FHA domain-containing protein [Linnemannia elongata]